MHVQPEQFVERFKYDPDSGALYWKTTSRAGKEVTRVATNGYIHAFAFYRNWPVHTIAFAIMNGAMPDLVDHKNGIRTDNRWANLREATTQQNAFNRSALRGMKGSTFHKQSGKYQAAIKINNKNIYLGLFETEREANAAYKGAAKVLFRDFARSA